MLTRGTYPTASDSAVLKGKGYEFSTLEGLPLNGFLGMRSP